jgi:hypothetical protein
MVSCEYTQRAELPREMVISDWLIPLDGIGNILENILYSVYAE